jgi:hypothetical protein
MKKIVVLLLFILISLSGFSQIIHSENNKSSHFIHYGSLNQDKELFLFSYLELTGKVDFIFQLNDIPIGFNNAFISYWPMRLIEPDTEVKIYDHKNGEILWADRFTDGEWDLHLIGFIGFYENKMLDNGNINVSLMGKTFCILLMEEK